MFVSDELLEANSKYARAFNRGAPPEHLGAFLEVHFDSGAERG